MARRKSFMVAMAQLAREDARRRQRATREALRQEKERIRSIQVQAKTDEKYRKELYLQSRLDEVESLNRELDYQIEDLENILLSTLNRDDYIDFAKLKKPKPQYAPFYEGNLGTPFSKPSLDKLLPEPLSGFKKMVPGAQKRYEQEVNQAKEYFEKQLKKYDQSESDRLEQLARRKSEHEQSVAKANKEVDDFNAEIDLFEQEFSQSKPDAIVKYFSLVLDVSVYPEEFPQKVRLAFVPESKQLVIEYDLPTFEIVPEVVEYRYVKTKDEIASKNRNLSERKSLYAAAVAQITLRTLHEIFEADRLQHIESVVFNGVVDTIDKRTGQPARPCLVSVRTTRDVFNGLDLSKVDPALCLKALSASVSSSPSELAPVRPVLEFNMIDSRFIEETDVLSMLDQRPNLMDLSPSEFESLITNLFEKMGLETRLTQASRDGGVDCVAYDPRPIFGGKVVIQAKRYKNTVGVSAVRDLFGTMQNEGASKGILVATSGYGKAAYEFAEGKPLELLSGSNLLHLLAEHAGIEAKIEVPDNWKDPIMDVPNQD